MRVSSLISLAAACNVSLEWLATGAETRPAEPSQPADPAAPLELWAMVNMDRMASALRITTQFLADHHIQASWMHRARMAVNSYDLLGKPDGPEDFRPPLEDEYPVD